jgi:hypothetical protein
VHPVILQGDTGFYFLCHAGSFAVRYCPAGLPAGYNLVIYFSYFHKAQPIPGKIATNKPFKIKGLEQYLTFC